MIPMANGSSPAAVLGTPPRRLSAVPPLASAKVPCRGGCGTLVTPGTKTGMCVPCFREARRLSAVARYAGPVCVSCRHGSCTAITPLVPCRCGTLVGRGGKTGLCTACVRDAWRSGELTHARPGAPRREAPAYTTSLCAMIRALGRRVGDGKDIENLPAFTRVRAELDAAERAAVAGLRGAGYSWRDVGRVLGCTREAAQARFGQPAATRDARNARRRKNGA